MILRKPYAFFIKIFKPAHIFISFLILYLVYKTKNILVFFNEYIYLEIGGSVQQTNLDLVSNALFYIPIIIIIFSFVFLGIMYMKKKNVVFYLITILIFLVVLIISIYSVNFLGIMEKTIVTLKLVKLHHDLILINIIIESLFFLLFLIRGLGINFKKFNFDSDISKLNVSDFDKEEIEVSVNIDVDLAKRNRRKKLRYLKYKYIENKLLVNIILSAIVILCFVISTCIISLKTKTKIEGSFYSINNFSVIVNKTVIVKEDFSGNELTENNLVVIDLSMKSNFSEMSFFLKDIKLEIGSAIFPVQTKYENSLIDLGISYKEDLLTNELNNYLLIFEIPDKYLTTDMFLVINNSGIKTKIKLKPKEFVSDEFINSKTLTKEISFKETLGDISFKIEDFEIKEKFLINYKYCVETECINSKEYIKPTINKNFDKNILKLKVKFSDNSRLNIKTFYNFFDIFGSIVYKIGDNWFVQTNDFEEIKSKKIAANDEVYIGVNSNVMYADSIKLVFNIRNSKYEYILK